MWALEYSWAQTCSENYQKQNRKSRLQIFRIRLMDITRIYSAKGVETEIKKENLTEYWAEFVEAELKH